VTAVAVAVFVVVFGLHAALSAHQSVEQQIGEQVYSDSCQTKVSPNEGVARRWPGASRAEVIVCQTSEDDEFANYVMDYAQFGSAAALSTTLESTPPHGAYCTFGTTVVTLDDLRAAFAAMCSNRGGTLHS
jgi:hypothetical protein